MTMLANDVAVEIVAPSHRGRAPISASTHSAFHQVQSAKGDEARQAQLKFLIAVASEALVKAIGLSATKLSTPLEKGSCCSIAKAYSQERISYRHKMGTFLSFPVSYLEPITVKSFLLLSVALAATTLVSSQAVGRTISDEQMMKLDLGARVEQRCNRRAMGLVGREHRGFHPDELVAYAYGDPRSSGAVVDASGAAVRSGNAWYHLAYSCQTSADGLKIERFKYSLGGAIPKGDWAEHYLVAP